MSRSALATSRTLLSLVGMTAALSGCVADEAAPAAPDPVAFDVSAADTPANLTLSVPGELGQGGFLCTPLGCLGTPELRAANNVHALPLVNGTFLGAAGNITWQPESPLTTELQTFVGLTPPDCVDGCNWTPLFHAVGTSPLTFELLPEDLANSTVTQGQGLAVVIASTSNVEGLPVAVLLKGGQTFQLDAVAHLRVQG